MEQIRTYFNAERAESLLFLGAAFLALIMTLYILLRHRSDYTFGVATGLTAIAIIQTVVGLSIFLRSPQDIKRVEAMVQSRMIEVKHVEIPRMEKVMKTFQTYKYVEIGLIFLGICLMFQAINTSFWSGLGLALLLEASAMLAFDFFAERRGLYYLEWLKGLVSI
jgi:hypothetical protein